MPLAALQIALPSADQVDPEKGIVRGCKLATANVTAVFAGKDGKPVSLKMTPTLIDDLFGLAQKQGRLDAYWTHDRLNDGNEDADFLHDSVGVWKNFAKDADGNLIADAVLEPSQYRDRILWKAQNDPAGIMTSLVFDYTGDPSNARARSIDSGDFVRFAAANTALLSAYTSPTTKTAKLNAMDINELLTALQDPQVLDALKAVIKSVESNQDDQTSADDVTPDEVAEMEDAADITPSSDDKKDATQPALMKRYRKAVLAVAQKVKTNAAALTSAQEEELLKKAEARFTSKIGSSAVLKDFVRRDNSADEFETAVTAQLAAGAKDRPTAILRLSKDKPDLYNAAVKAGKI